ncbi:DUF4166 domain-containing protein [Evansella sp. AB-P1]|uniref:DUF4166 domain-containing protein n=1 Tax=Evansella sp. AB-P1 TaxID=3037653 RepID=UPI00241CA867|nr:DUF4166 domain-containing protein [Evansella sp. AB-P1]MDG5786187.1 DUF4166 domain-containing protein [Evansella sp. AB-P1]
MKSIYERNLGDRFKELHPLLQRKFSLNSEREEIAYGEGTMFSIKGGRGWMKPFFHLASKRNFLYPERGSNIPFTIKNVAFKDPYGRETVAWIRRFHFEEVTRGFDATMVFSEKSGGIIDYLGNKQRLISPLTFHVTNTGGLIIQSGRPYFWISKVKIVAPKWMAPIATIREEVLGITEEVTIQVNVSHPLFGCLIDYQGLFRLSFEALSSNEIPKDVYPKMYTKRE